MIYEKDEKFKLLAKKIEQAMKDKVLNRTEFAAMMNVWPSSITRWLSGKHNFELKTLYEIERKLEISLIKLD